jgi:hypothetical protein
MSTGIKITNLTCNLSSEGSELIAIVKDGTTLKSTLSTAIQGTLNLADLSARSILSNPQSNQNPGEMASVFGGQGNYGGGGFSTIIGGLNNCATGNCSIVIGGVNNCNNTQSAIILGGQDNIITCCDPENTTSIIIAGCTNTINHSGTIILGASGLKTAVPDFTYVKNLSVLDKFSSPTIKVTDFLVTQNLSVLGDEVIFNTVTTTTSALSVTNDGTGPALYVQQD